MSWVGVYLGMSVPTVEVAQQVGFIVDLPADVRLERVRPARQTLPTWLQPFAEWNPISTLRRRPRELFGNPNPYVGEWIPSQYPILVTIGWMILLVSIFAPMAINKYRNASK